MFILVECVEREIEMSIFDTYEDAYNAMKEAYEVIVNDKCSESEITSWSAWVDDGTNHNNYDWKIFYMI